MKIIGIGASAGGLEALSDLLDHLPNDTGAVFIVIQHLSPKFKSIMDELLGTHTKMPVKMVKTDTQIEPNHVYLLAGGYNMVISNKSLILKKIEDPHLLNLPIDSFFHSLGEEKKEDAIAVVLSGSGTDGSRGIRTVKENGGCVLVQSPNSAKFSGMPKAAIRIKIADSILPPENLAKEITHIVQYKQEGDNGLQIDLQEGQSKDYFQAILQRILELHEVDLRAYREGTLLRRIEKRMLLLRSENIEDYYNIINKNEDEVDTLFNDILIGVTRFYRDKPAFDLLQEQIFPAMIEGKGPQEQLRIWISACSTGEEAYTVGMLLDEFIKENNLSLDFKIFASDIDKAAIGLAAEGFYAAGASLDLPKRLLQKYFNNELNGYRVRRELREKILFAVHDVLSDPPFIRMNLICCRNFLIYIKQPIQRKVLTTFHFSLKGEGVLFLGPSESLGDVKHAFSTLNRKWNFYQKRADSTIPIQHAIGRDRPDFWKNRPATQFVNQHEQIRRLNDDYNNPFTRYLLTHYQPITIFLDEYMHILYSTGNIGSIFRMPRAVVNFKINNVVGQQEAAIFQKGVAETLFKNQPVSFDQVPLKKEDQVIIVDLVFKRANLPELDYPVVIVEITTEVATTPIKQRIEINEKEYISEQVIGLQLKLNNSEQEMRRLVDELEYTNEELNTSNQELLASNQELQSTNEELQSVNEELSTVNSELQTRNDELRTSNNDIDNLLKSIEIGTLFLDMHLQIRKYTPTILKYFDLVEEDIGRPITHFSHSFKDLHLHQVGEQVLKNRVPYEEQIQDNSGRHFLLRIHPYQTEHKEIDGLVVSFIDV